MSRSKEEIEKLQKNEEKKESENLPNIKAPIMNAFKKMVTEKITIESDDDGDEKNNEKLDVIKKEIKESKNEDNKKEIDEDNKKNDKKEENEEEENELFNEEEENKPKSEKPKPLVSQDFSNYEKKYNNHIDNFYVFSRITKKYVSKGNGFLSVEISKDKNKKSSVIVFRNQGGNKLVEGFIRPNISKIEGEEKNYKNIATIWYIYLNELGNTELGAAKIPFSNSEDFKNFKTAFEESIKYIERK